MNTYLIIGENIYYLDSENNVFSVEYYTGYILKGCELNRFFVNPSYQSGLIVEMATQQEIEDQVELNILIDIKKKYEFHKQNGWNAYQDFRAKVVNDIYKGLITETEAFLIEDNLSVAYDQISTTGDWKTARYKLMQVSPYPPFVQPYYELAMSLINEYITNNYED
jgi:hypothetical protein